MGAFYAALSSGVDAAEAHRRAVIAVRRTHPHPSRWGAFFLTGHPVPGSSEPDGPSGRMPHAVESNLTVGARLEAPVLSESL